MRLPLLLAAALVAGAANAAPLSYEGALRLAAEALPPSSSPG